MPADKPAGPDRPTGADKPADKPTGAYEPAGADRPADMPARADKPAAPVTEVAAAVAPVVVAVAPVTEVVAAGAAVVVPVARAVETMSPPVTRARVPAAGRVAAPGELDAASGGLGRDWGSAPARAGLGYFAPLGAPGSARSSKPPAVAPTPRVRRARGAARGRALGSEGVIVPPGPPPRTPDAAAGAGSGSGTATPTTPYALLAAALALVAVFFSRVVCVLAGWRPVRLVSVLERPG